MSEIRNAFFYRDTYYLIPDEYEGFDSFKNSINNPPYEIKLMALTENNKVHSIIEKGVCIAPYFYKEYGYAESNVLIENTDELYPVTVELFNQKEYNDRLREAILSYCPGCQRYKPISNRVQSLNGHFEEISLNSVCFYRQNTKPAPRVFKEYLFGLGGLWHHFDPAQRKAEDVSELIKSMLKIKYDSAVRVPDQPTMTVTFKSDFFIQLLSDVLAKYIEQTLTFTEFRLAFDRNLYIDNITFENQLSGGNIESFQKNCKKYGVSLAVMIYDPAFEEQIERSLEPLYTHYLAYAVFKDFGKLYLLLMDECNYLKSLHYRSPILESAQTRITIYNQYGESAYRISFNMEKEPI